MTTNRNLDIIYYKRETIVIIPILNIYWQDIFIVRVSHDLCVTHVSQSMEALIQLSTPAAPLPPPLPSVLQRTLLFLIIG